MERIKIVQAIEALGKELESERLKRAADACKGFRALGSKLHTPLMERLAKICNIEDRALPKLLEHGLPIVGRALESPFFEPHEIEAKTSVEECLASAKARRTTLMQSMLTSSNGNDSSAHQAAFDKTMKE
eukprot:6588505-Heterocapsa_arctica.AAC.1